MEPIATGPPVQARRTPAWLAGLVPLAVLALAIVAFVALDAPGLERNGVPVEDVAVERTELRPGQIELHLRNVGPDAVTVDDAIVPFELDGPRTLDRLRSSEVPVG